jgi:hypothetical protein
VAIKLQLALMAYRLDHGQYPEQLAELVPDYLKHLPIDPFGGEPFCYHPHGLPTDLIAKEQRDLDYAKSIVPPKTALFWSRGLGDRWLVLRSNFCYFADRLYLLSPDVDRGVERGVFRDAMQVYVLPTTVEEQRSMTWGPETTWVRPSTEVHIPN